MATKHIPKLSDIVASEEMNVLTMSNIDDLFTKINKVGIREVEVNKEQMLMAAKFFVAMFDSEGHKGEMWNCKAWRVLSEGKLDSFLGVKLKLNANS